MKPFVLWKGTLKELFPDRDYSQSDVYRVVVDCEQRQIIVELRHVDAMGNDSWTMPDSIKVKGDSCTNYTCVNYVDLFEAICITIALEIREDNDALLARLGGNKQ